MTNIKKQLSALSLLSLVGAAFSISSTQHYYELRGGMAGFKSFCNMGQTMNCDVVAASSYAEFMAGFPLSSFATGWFIALFFLTLFARGPSWRRESVRGILIMTLIGTVFSAIYFLIMVMILKTYCLLCLGVDAINLVSLGLALSLQPESLKKAKPDASQWKSLAGVVLGSVLVSVIALKGMDSLSYKQSDLNDMINNILSSAPVSVNAGEEFPSMGAKDAPVTIVEFSDFQCPHCRHGAMIMHTLLNKYDGKLRVVHRNFPLDPSCNRDMPNAGHPVACEASRAATCAFKQGKFAPVYEEIFDKQETLANGLPQKYAIEAGVDAGIFQACMNAPETASAVARDLDEGRLLGVTSTPTFFINGRRVEGALPVPVWSKVIDQLAGTKN